MGGRKREERWGRGVEKGRVEENLREWDSREGGRTEMRARKEISLLREPFWGSKKPGYRESPRNPQGDPS